MHGSKGIGYASKPSASPQLCRQGLDLVPNQRNRLLHPMTYARRLELLGSRVDRHKVRGEEVGVPLPLAGFFATEFVARV